MAIEGSPPPRPPPSRGRGAAIEKRPDSLHKENHNPSAKDQNQEDDDGTKPYQPILSISNNNILDEIEEDRTYNRARKGMDASEQSDHHRFG